MAGLLIGLAGLPAFGDELPRDAEARFQIKYGRPSPTEEAEERRIADALKRDRSEVFTVLDRNKDGRVDAREFRRHEALLLRLGLFQTPQQERFRKLDSNGDGKLNASEWKDGL
ncbi:MAG TPA: EF-hand domain-containing protein [Bryobacteraceae bacterium]|nr:EF-hand domain-containing protein [Bryobacteraceae bacterium]